MEFRSELSLIFNNRQLHL